MSALSGDEFLVVPIGGHTTIDDAYQSVDKHLDGSVVFTLMHNDADIYDWQHAESQITSPVKREAPQERSS